MEVLTSSVADEEKGRGQALLPTGVPRSDDGAADEEKPAATSAIATSEPDSVMITKDKLWWKRQERVV